MQFYPVTPERSAVRFANFVCVYFSPFRVPQSAGTDAFLQSWDGLLAYAFPPWSGHSPGPGDNACFSGNLSDVSGSVLAPEAMVSRALGLGCGSSVGVTVSPRPCVSAPVGSAPSRSPQASTSCLETLRRFTQAADFSSGVTSQVGLARRASSRTNYHLKWSTFRSWCRAKGHSICIYGCGLLAVDTPPLEAECLLHYGVQVHALDCIPISTAGPVFSSSVA